MKYATAGAFRTALERRLITMAGQMGVPLVRPRKLVVFDRLMARLMVVAPNRWVVKGALALHLRLGPRFRTTKDMDLGRQDGEEDATADFLAAQLIDLGDYFTFVVERTKKLDATEGAAVRYHVTAELAGRPFEDVTVDVSFGETLIADPELVRAQSCSASLVYRRRKSRRCPSNNTSLRRFTPTREATPAVVLARASKT